MKYELVAANDESVSCALSRVASACVARGPGQNQFSNNYTMYGSNQPRGLYGSTFDSQVERMDESAVSKMQRKYWQAKQLFLATFKKKEDECIVAADADLDAKLELFKSIEDTCAHLLWTLERYQDRIWVMSHSEGSFARFLKDAANADKSRAAIMLRASGRTLSLTATNRIQLRDPLVRLYRDIETFQYRAVTDTYDTIDKMETSRTAYRAALLWMKDISQKLDPDTYNQLEKFRKVQAHVRRCKNKFEKVKLDTHQKIDMLSASRVNMLNNALAVYQKGLLNFYKKSSETLTSISEVFTGFQYFEFTVVKELRDQEKRQRDLETLRELEQKLKRIFGEEKESEKSILALEAAKEPGEQVVNLGPKEQQTEAASDLLELYEQQKQDLLSISSQEGKHLTGNDAIRDLLTECEPDEKELLSEIFSTPSSIPSLVPSQSTSTSSFLPSQLLADFGILNLSEKSSSGDQSKSVEKTAENQSSIPSGKKGSGASKDPVDKWLNLFAELDPLSNPDSIGSETDQDRNC